MGRIGKKPVGVLCFPGTQCDEDVIKAIRIFNCPVEKIRHKDRFFSQNYSAFILPGGFSYGDYLRAGALSARAPAMQDLCSSAKKGWPILGICNGFQILCEAGLLDGILRINNSLRFIDQWVQLELCNNCPSWGGGDGGENEKKANNKTAYIPIAHGEGAFYTNQDGLKKLEDQEQIWWKYKHNPNGSSGDIAGIISEQKNVAGLMPHPERAVADWMGGTDGLMFFSRIGL